MMVTENQADFFRSAGCGAKTPAWFDSLYCWLSSSVDASSLAVFRICFGLVMTFAMVRFLVKGWVKTLYLDPGFHFPWFSWIQPWPGIWMYVHVTVLAVCALGLALGFFYRCCAVFFFIGFTYLELIDRTTYLNHYYLISLLAGLLIFLPAHRQWSIDAWRKPHLTDSTIPAWTLWLLRFQIIVVYFFAGLAKLNADWLFAAQPMRIWLTARSDLPIAGPWLAEPWMAYLASWFGAIFDLSIPFLLLLSRTRPAAYAAVVLFHIITAFLFPIGMFPWIMIAITLIFFPPDWPRRLLALKGNNTSGETKDHFRPRVLSKSGICLLASYCLVQLIVPLRAWFYPQQGAWDGRGFNFAWRVMLVEKTGNVEFFGIDPKTRTHERIALQPYITSRQRMMMAQDPHMIRIFAAYLSDQYALAGKPGWEIRAEAFTTLNGRPSQQLVNSDINLAAANLNDWIVPLQTSR